MDLTVNDNTTAQAYRARYAEAKAKAPPSVIQCDTMAGDTWFHGIKLGERATAWTALWTGGKGTYCTTQQEDNATYMPSPAGPSPGLWISTALLCCGPRRTLTVPIRASRPGTRSVVVARRVARVVSCPPLAIYGWRPRRSSRMSSPTGTNGSTASRSSACRLKLGIAAVDLAERSTAPTRVTTAACRRLQTWLFGAKHRADVDHIKLAPAE